MARQRTLDFRQEGLGTLWERMPEWWRQDVLALYAQLITRAAQQPPRAPARRERNVREEQNDA
jgi:hypothetical protein